MIVIDSSATPTTPGRQAGASCNLLYSNDKKLSQASCAVYVIKRSEMNVAVVKVQSREGGPQVSCCSACRSEVMLQSARLLPESA
jgi:hypothetical protein